MQAYDVGLFWCVVVQVNYGFYVATSFLTPFVNAMKFFVFFIAIEEVREDVG